MRTRWPALALVVVGAGAVAFVLGTEEGGDEQPVSSRRPTASSAPVTVPPLGTLDEPECEQGQYCFPAVELNGRLFPVTCDGPRLDDLGVTVGAHGTSAVGSSRVDLQACKLEYSIVSPK